jgi:zinc and cadmium transporter
MSITIVYIIVSVILVSAVSLIGLLALSRQGAVWLNKKVHLLVGLATGALLGDALLHLLPEAFEELPETAPLLVLAGILLFFILEKVLHWHHSHQLICEDPNDPSTCRLPDHGSTPLGKMIIVSDALHNFIDGAIIAASYLVSLPVGIATTIAVVLHEMPQEIGDFGVLVHSGYTRGRALFLNFLSALTAVVGALVVLLFGSTDALNSALLPIAGGAFLYVAAADLVPELKKTTKLRESLLQLGLVLIGIGLMYMLTFIE